MSESITRTELIAALDWQIELGADEAISDTFHDRTLTPPPAPKKTKQRRHPPPQAFRPRFRQPKRCKPATILLLSKPPSPIILMS